MNESDGHVPAAVAVVIVLLGAGTAWLWLAAFHCAGKGGC